MATLLHHGIDAAGLEGALERVTSAEVRFDAGSRGLYSTGGSNYRQIPIGVVVPRSVDDVESTVATCREFGAPVLGRGGGTSLAGQSTNVAVVIDFSKHLNHILSIDPHERTARVEPGVVLDDLRHSAQSHGLTFGPDPSTHAYCTFGGMIGNNSCGVHSVMSGRTSDNVEALEILTYDGERMRVAETPDVDAATAAGGRRGKIHADLRALAQRHDSAIRSRYPTIPRRVSGYNLDELLPERGFNVARALVGTESTCALVLEATIRLVESPRVRRLVVLGFEDVAHAADAVPSVMKHAPIGLEGIDDVLVEYMRRKGLHAQDATLLPQGGGWLLVEVGADNEADALAKADAVVADLDGDAVDGKVIVEEQEATKLWEIRESGLGATAFVPGEKPTWEGWEDAAVPPERLGPYLRDFRSLLDDYGYGCSLYGHFGDGCIHTRIDFDLKTAHGIGRFRSFINDAADLVVSYGGSLSGEHGDGQARAELLPKMFGTELIDAFRAFKAIWDPDNKMNPNKVVDPHRADENLRFGVDYRPRTVSTFFDFSAEGGSFGDAAARCVGVGKCRKHDSGTMCPSYMVTGEERHSTRGRSRLLFEMMRGDHLRDGWRDASVREALDLCLACKACRSECPVNVDMATYKAEFLAHHYRNKIRPVQAYSLGLIHWWARAASHSPRLANTLMRWRPTSSLIKRLGGVASAREAPAFAEETFREWFRRNREQPLNSADVILWPDTFTNHFEPDVGRAAVDILDAAGCSVSIPGRVLCCGRPLYDFGMLDTAKRVLRRTLGSLRNEIAAGVPVVGLEPSCVAVFRDELVRLFPDDEDAKRLSKQMFTLAEFLEQRGFKPPRVDGQVLMHRHCHHQAVMGTDVDQRLLRAAGFDFEVLDSGCCGLAGSFGFERGDKYEVSRRAGERILAPAVREAPEETIVLTDGFSCRTQIRHLTGRDALHLAQVLQQAVAGARAR